VIARTVRTHAGGARFAQGTLTTRMPRKLFWAKDILLGSVSVAGTFTEALVAMSVPVASSKT